MADELTTTTEDEVREPVDTPGTVVDSNEDAGAADVPETNVTAQAAKITDDSVEVREPDAQVTQQKVAAQVTQPREPEADTVNVHEVSVTTDTVILDTSDPRAVQVPEAGRSPLEKSGLPISKLDNERVEDVFAREASKPDDES